MKGSFCPPCVFFSVFTPTSDKPKMKRLFATFPAVIGALLIVIVDDASQMFAAGPWFSPGFKFRQHNS